MADRAHRRLPSQPPDARQRLYQLHASPDPRDRARALREAAGGTPIPPPVLRYLERAGAGLQRAVKNVDQCVQLDPTASWTPGLQALLTQIQDLQEGELAQVVADVEAYFEGSPEADIPAAEVIDEAEDGDGAVDQGRRELDPEDNSAAPLDCGTPIGTDPDSASQAFAEVENGAPVCGWCGSTQTWRAEAAGRIHCDHCHAVYNPGTGGWDAGERAKHRATAALTGRLG